jgi:hypothetical protein
MSLNESSYTAHAAIKRVIDGHAVVLFMKSEPIQRTWNRDDAAQLAEAYAALFPPYQLLIESYTKAQEVVTRHEVLDLRRK